MQIIRTIVWIAITAALVAFVAMNWEQAPVNFWPLENSYMHVMAPVGLIAIFFFALGALPMWLLAKAGRWRMSRRMTALENSVRVVSPIPQAAADAPQVASSPELSHGIDTGVAPHGDYPGESREIPTGTYPGDRRDQ